ncbi:MAG: hypothetical protein KJZ62_00090 [Fimbriimonadaceae bacterium]|nr:hypothetical protein [Fimbriimonadaceae bacterium]QOJ11230.1 MAG: hypothetical protein HRU74_03880 [Chthonomonadaceae bacterium]
MILEQAFNGLPEVLLGSPYLAQEYEEGVVAAFAMSVLQELNGRNISNPLSLVCLEQAYALPKGSRRGLRYDLYVNQGTVGVSSAALARFHYRKHNVLEAKFFRRNPRGTSIKPAVTASDAVVQLAVDLVRLCCLPYFLEPKAKDIDPDVSSKDIGRYLLHIYDLPPRKYFEDIKDDAGNKTGTVPAWLDGLLKPGQGKGLQFVVERESSKVRQEFPSPIGALKISFNATNFEQCPTSLEPERPNYHCYLSRLDSLRVELEKEWFEFDELGEFVESANGRFNIMKSVFDMLGKELEQPGEDQVATLGSIFNASIEVGVSTATATMLPVTVHAEDNSGTQGE